MLQTTFRGLGDVKRNKHLSLTTRFENLRMHDDEPLISILSFVILLMNPLCLVKRFLKVHSFGK